MGKSKKKEPEAPSSAAAEDADWAAAGDGKVSKAQQKKAEQAAKSAEAAVKKLEGKKLAAAEDAELAGVGKKKAASAAEKASQFQLRQKKEADARELEKVAKKAAAASKRTVTEDDYTQIVDGENVNRRDESAEARSMEDAIAVLALKETEEEADRHPERRQKSAHMAFEEAEVARLREEKPGMRTSQYKELAFKGWQKSPLNPINQAALAAAQQDAPPKRR